MLFGMENISKKRIRSPIPAICIVGQVRYAMMCKYKVHKRIFSICVLTKQHDIGNELIFHVHNCQIVLYVCRTNFKGQIRRSLFNKRFKNNQFNDNFIFYVTMYNECIKNSKALKWISTEGNRVSSLYMHLQKPTLQDMRVTY